MALVTATAVSKIPITGSSAGHVLCTEGSVAVAATLDVADLVALCVLPAEHEPVDLILEPTDLDTHGTPTITLTVGVLNADQDDLVANTDFLTASTAAQTGVAAHATNIKGLQLAASSADRIIAVKVIAAAATAAAGTISCKLLYRRKTS